MNQTVCTGERYGEVSVPSSKSATHRFLICSALADKKTVLTINGLSKDIMATINCLTALGATFTFSDSGRVEITPIADKKIRDKNLYCGESGSTLRFLLPLVGVLGRSVTFHMEGLLSKRPHDALINVLAKHGQKFVKKGNLLQVSGKLQPGLYEIPGNISSQYVSGLLFALPLLDEGSTIVVHGNVESTAYIYMTENTISEFGIKYKKSGHMYDIKGGQKYKAPKDEIVEKDWSAAAFFLCLGALSEKGVTVKGMNLNSIQGDKKIVRILKDFGANVKENENGITVKKGKLKGMTVDASEIPDLVPIISVVASVASGETIIKNAGRLRFKETDRLKTTKNMIDALGGNIQETEDGLIITGKRKLSGGYAESAKDHRIAMSAAVAASVCKNEVTVLNSECTDKSYPDFWEDFMSLGVKKQ